MKSTAIWWVQLHTNKSHVSTGWQVGLALSNTSETHFSSQWQQRLCFIWWYLPWLRMVGGQPHISTGGITGLVRWMRPGSSGYAGWAGGTEVSKGKQQMWTGVIAGCIYMFKSATQFKSSFYCHVIFIISWLYSQNITMTTGGSTQWEYLKFGTLSADILSSGIRINMGREKSDRWIPNFFPECSINRWSGHSVTASVLTLVVASSERVARWQILS